MRAATVGGAALLACLVASGATAFGARSDAPRGTAAAICAGTASLPDGQNSTLIDAATLCLMNHVRAEYGLRALRRSRPLAAIAAGQAGDMVSGDYFGDQSLSGRSPLSRVLASHYAVSLAHMRLLTAQNIGWGTGPNATPAGIVAAWMQSPPHRSIILTAAYRDAGVGVAPAVPAALGSSWLGGTYAVEFGARQR
jgi:uncharacterized protein YkwD